MYKEFKDKIAIITGGAMGMGLAAGQAFAKAGAVAILIDAMDGFTTGLRN